MHYMWRFILQSPLILYNLNDDTPSIPRANRRLRTLQDEASAAVCRNAPNYSRPA